MIGKRFGRWVVIEETDLKYINKSRFWKCECDCGTVKLLTANSLRTGMTKSCGCLKYDKAKIQFLKHGHNNNNEKSRTYTTWDNMIQRCSNPNRKEYKYYGGRGIVVCDEWKDFEKFYSDMGERPEERSLDRINPNGNYELSNCRWATKEEQYANRRPRKERS